MSGEQRLFGLEGLVEDEDASSEPLPVARSRGAVATTDGAAQHTERRRPGATEVDLTRALPHLLAQALQRVARRFAPVGRLPVKKADLCDMVAAVLASPERLDAVIARLAPYEREALAELARRGGSADAWELATHLALRGYPTPPFERRPYAFNPWLGRSGAAAYLTPMVDDGLLVRGGSPAAPATVHALHDSWVGADPRLLARLPRSRPAPVVPLELPVADRSAGDRRAGALAAGAPTACEHAPGEPTAEAPAPAQPASTATPTSAVHPLAVVLETLDAAYLVLDLGGVPLTRAETIARPFVRRVQRERPQRAMRMESLLHTLFALGLMRPPPERGGGRAPPWSLDRERFLALLRAPPHLAYASIVDAACRVGDGLVDVRWSEGLYGAAPANALRYAVLDALPALPNHPVELEAAAAALWRGPLLRVFGWADREDSASDFGRRQPPEVAAVLAGTCVRLGLLATSGKLPERGGPVGDPPAPQAIVPALGARRYAAVRARSLGHGGPEDPDGDGSGWDRSDPAVAAPEPGDSDVATPAPGDPLPLVVQPNFEVLAYLDRLDAEAVAALACATVTRLDAHTATFVLDRWSVNRALDLGRDLGWDVDGVIAGLRAHAGALNESVERAIRDWAAQRERLRVTMEARLVEYPDAAGRDAGLSRLPGARAVGERFALLAPSTKTPERERHRYTEPPERHLVIDRSGTLRIDGRLDLAGRVVVHALTRSGPRGRLVFDPEAIRAGPLPGGWRDVLKVRLARPAPPNVDALLRAWSGDGPRPVLESVTLFRHPKASAWAQHPRVAPHLGAALNDTTYLVAPESVGPLTQELQALGVTLDAAAAPAAAATSNTTPHATSGATSGAAPNATGGAVDGLVAGLSTRRTRERLEEAIAAGHDVELRYAVERERYGRYGRVHRSRGRTRTARFTPLEVTYRGSLPYLHALPLDGEDGDDDEEEVIRIGYIKAIAVRP